MPQSENKEFLRKYFAALSGKPKPAAVVDQFVTEQTLKDHIAGAEVGFPEYILSRGEMIAEGDKVAVKVPGWNPPGCVQRNSAHGAEGRYALPYHLPDPRREDH